MRCVVNQLSQNVLHVPGRLSLNGERWWDRGSIVLGLLSSNETEAIHRARVRRVRALLYGSSGRESQST